MISGVRFIWLFCFLFVPCVVGMDNGSLPDEDAECSYFLQGDDKECIDLQQNFDDWVKYRFHPHVLSAQIASNADSLYERVLDPTVRSCVEQLRAQIATIQLLLSREFQDQCERLEQFNSPDQFNKWEQRSFSPATEQTCPDDSDFSFFRDSSLISFFQK